MPSSGYIGESSASRSVRWRGEGKNRYEEVQWTIEEEQKEKKRCHVIQPLLLLAVCWCWGDVGAFSLSLSLSLTWMKSCWGKFRYRPCVRVRMRSLNSTSACRAHPKSRTEKRNIQVEGCDDAVILKATSVFLEMARWCAWDASTAGVEASPPPTITSRLQHNVLRQFDELLNSTSSLEYHWYWKCFAKNSLRMIASGREKRARLGRFENRVLFATDCPLSRSFDVCDRTRDFHREKSSN